MQRRSRTAALASAIVLLLASGLSAQQPNSLHETVQTLLEKPAAQRAAWGIQAVDLNSGEVIYQLDADKLFVPASNGKLFSTALALSRLGADYRFTTQVVAEKNVLEDGSLPGNLRLIGGGDPTLSSRVVPYDPKAEFAKDRLEPMRELARQIVESGVKRVQGDIIGDDTRWVWDPYAPGWSIEDAVWGYGAPVSALAFNDNFVEILVQPGAAAGQKARLRFNPDADYFEIRNLTRTAPTATVAQNLGLRRPGEPRRVDLWGQISIRSPGRAMEVAVDDPALFAAKALRKALEEAGVSIEGETRAEHAEPYRFASLKAAPKAPETTYPATLAVITSPSLAEGVKLTNKMSLNLHAEMLLREAGYQARGVGSVEAGIEEMRKFLREAGLSPWEFFLEDGSGLSRKNLVSPAGTVKLLRHMAASEAGTVYRDSLPVAGDDGTLDWRFSRTAAKGRIQAKTGTLSHVTALAGYATTPDGRELAFAVFVNNFGVSTSYIRNILDQIIVEIVTAPAPSDVSGS